MSSLVTIIIPTHNYGFLIKETLQSILESAYANLEVIVVDDGSTDNTKVIVQDFIKKDERCTYVFQEKKGVSAARNTGLRLAKGKYIQFMDADDLLSHKKILIQVNEMESDLTIDISHVKSYYFKDKEPETLYLDFEMKNISWLKELDGRGFQLIEEMLGVNLATIHSPLVRKSFIDAFSLDFDESMTHIEDWDFWFKCAINNAYVKYINNGDAYVLVRVHPVSASQNGLKFDLGEIVFRRKIDEYIRNSSLEQEEKKSLTKSNKHFQKQSIKILIFNFLSDFPFLRDIYLRAGFSTFTLCLLKALVRKLKISLKP